MILNNFSSDYINTKFIYNCLYDILEKVKILPGRVEFLLRYLSSISSIYRSRSDMSCETCQAQFKVVKTSVDLDWRLVACACPVSVRLLAFEASKLTKKITLGHVS